MTVRTIAVSVGTDHHPFNRLMDWLDSWAAGRSEIRLLVQHGPAHPVSGAAQNRDRLPQPELLAWIGGADTVVLQGGPGGILDALRLGHRPIVVPRLAELGEVVDDHQVAFCHLMEQRGFVAVAEDPDTLAGLLDRPRYAHQPGEDLTKSMAAGGPLRVAELLDERSPRLTGRQVARRVREVLGAHQSGSRAAGLAEAEAATA